MQRSLTIFEGAIKTEATREAYLYQLEKFREWTKIKDFDSLLQAPQKNIQELLEDYVMYLKKKVSPNSVPIYYAPIELFFVMNDVTINYKKLRKLFPKKVKKGNERGYTIEEIRKIVKNTKSKRNRALVLLFASSGIRLGAIPDILLKHLTKIGKNSYAIKIYEDETEEDYIFTTPEATKSIDEYLDERKKDGEYVDQNSPLIRTSYKLGIEKAKSCNLDTLAHVMARLVSCVDRKKRGNRYDVPKDHGYRKFYGTVIKDTQGITPTMSEKLINHIGVVQLDGSYFKPTKEQMFESYQKVISGLTIDQTEKHEALIESQKGKISELEQNQNRIDNLEKHILQEQRILDLVAVGGLKVSRKDGRTKLKWTIDPDDPDSIRKNFPELFEEEKDRTIG
ncbi:MAG: hypothetical protein NPMRTH1_270027 [Nitrosopumilales archaeon]|nr:MAG: hypothetical protein NPMRTH1_270027 [Nitrosopumilales archaeon]